MVRVNAYNLRGHCVGIATAKWGKSETTPFMKPPLRKFLIAASVLSLASIARALTLVPADAEFTGTNNSNLSPSEIGTAHSLGTLFLLYKAEVGGSDSGTFANSYNTAFLDTPTDPSGASITYVGMPALVPSSYPLYLYVKDGNQNPAYYVFDISAWNGIETITLSNFWPNQGAISNLQILGGNTTGEIPPRDLPGPSVPDGGSTVALLGVALAAVALLRKKILG